MAVVGLYLQPDTSPYTSGTMDGPWNDLIDAVTNVNSTGMWWHDYAYGVDFGEEKTITEFRFWFNCGGTPSGWYGTDYDSVKIFKSSDGSSWTAIEQFDSPPISNTTDGNGMFTCTFSTAQTARYFKAVNVDTGGTTLATQAGTSLYITEIEWTESGEQTELVDVSLNLSAYYQDFEDLASWLRAHDGLELEDLKSLLHAAALQIEDLPIELSAYYQDLSDLAMRLETLGLGLADLATLLETQALGLEHFPLYLWSAKHRLDDIRTLLSAVDGTVFADLAALLWATDGMVLNDCRMNLFTIALIPAFQAVTAQRLTAVVSEVI